MEKVPRIKKYPVFETEEHFSLKKKIAEIYINKGYKVSTDVRTPYIMTSNKKRRFIVDILLKKDDRMIPVEIGSTNMEKVAALIRKYVEVWIVLYSHSTPIVLTKENFVDKFLGLSPEMHKQSEFIKEERKKRKEIEGMAGQPISDKILNKEEEDFVDIFSTVVDKEGLPKAKLLLNFDQLNTSIISEISESKDIDYLSRVITSHVLPDLRREAKTGFAAYFLRRVRQGMTIHDRDNLIQSYNFGASKESQVDINTFYNIRNQLIAAGLIEKIGGIYRLSNRLQELLKIVINLLYLYARKTQTI